MRQSYSNARYHQRRLSEPTFFEPSGLRVIEIIRHGGLLDTPLKNENGATLLWLLLLPMVETKAIGRGTMDWIMSLYAFATGRSAACRVI
jgi:hypothetical protein